MGKVVLEITLSLDGFVCGPDDDLERIHAWMFAEQPESDRAVLADSNRVLGAVIMGHGTFDDGIKKQGWSGWVDQPPFAVPMFVLAHAVPEKLERGKTAFTFVSGIENALAEAQAAANGKNVLVMGGANMAQQYIKAGLLDEIHIHLVPVMLVEGKRLFEHIGTERIELEPICVVNSPTVTHLQYRVCKDAG